MFEFKKVIKTQVCKVSFVAAKQKSCPNAKIVPKKVKLSFAAPYQVDGAGGVEASQLHFEERRLEFRGAAVGDLLVRAGPLPPHPHRRRRQVRRVQPEDGPARRVPGQHV